MGTTTVLMMFFLIMPGSQVSVQEENKSNTNLNDTFWNTSVSTGNNVDLRLLAVSPLALLRMASVNQTFRKLLSLPPERSGFNLFDLQFCSDFDTEKGQCIYHDLQLLLVQNNWSYLDNEKKRSRFPLCGIGTGDSGCDSFRILTSPCGTIGYKTFSTNSSLGCEWIIKCNEGQHIRLDFEYLNIKYCGRYCRCDSLTVYDLVDGREKGYVYCGRRGPWSIVTFSNELRITFVLNKSLPRTGFRLEYHAVKENTLPTTAPMKLNASNGNITIPLSPNRLEDGLIIYQWHIRVDEAMQIKMSWIMNSTCPADTRLDLHEGPKEEGTDHPLVLTGSRLSGNAVSKSFQISVQLKYPESCNIDTFEAFYEAFKTSDRHSTNGINSDYMPISQNVSTSVHISTQEQALPVIKIYRYIAPDGSFIALNIEEFTFNGPNTDDCKNEGFVIWDGQEESSVKYGPFCGIHYHTTFFSGQGGVPIHSSTNTLTLLFYSYGPKKETLLKFNVQMTSCIGIFSWNKLYEFDYFSFNNYPKRWFLKVKPVNKTCLQLQSLPSHEPCDQSMSVQAVSTYINTVITTVKRGYSYVPDCSVDVDVREWRLKEKCHCDIRPGGHLLRIQATKKCHNEHYDTDGKYRIYSGPGACGLVTIKDGSHRITFLFSSIARRFWSNYFFSLEITCGRCLYRRSQNIQLQIGNNFYESVKVTFNLKLKALPFRFDSDSDSLIIEITSKNIEVQIRYTRKQKSQQPPPVSATHVCPHNIPGTIELYRNICYVFPGNVADRQITWEMANQTCTRRGGRLLSVKSQDQLSFIKGMINRHWEGYFDLRRVIYIGLVRSEEDDRWTDDTPGTFNEWYRPQPSKTWIVPEEFLNEEIPFATPLLLQPHSDPSIQCTAMFLVTSNMPTLWFRVPCKYPYPGASFICEYPANNTSDLYNQTNMRQRQNQNYDESGAIFENMNNVTKLITGTRRCPPGYNQMQGHCYRLVSTTVLFGMPINCPVAGYICSKFNGTMVRTIRTFPTELLDIWLHRYEYGSIWIGDCDIIAYEKSKGKWITRTPASSETTKAINVVCETDPLTVNNSCGPGQFMCEDGTCILEIHVCDGKADCLEGGDEIETFCTDTVFTCGDGQRVPFSKYCDFTQDCRDNSDEKNCTVSSCPSNKTKCDNGQCIESYRFGDYITDCLDSSDEKPNYRQKSTCETFRCHYGECLPAPLIKNMRADCQGAAQEDEQLRISEVKRGDWKELYYKRKTMLDAYYFQPFCNPATGTQSPCRIDHVLCFERHTACLYDVNEYGYISSCPDGNHLRNCKLFECPGNFKCPDSYCIPVHKVCNGKPDCPDGQDELNCNNLSCPGLFKCSKEGICLDQSFVCDGVVHCRKSYDDEALCPFRKCPRGCVCKGRSATCTDPADHTLPSMPFDIRSLQLVTTTNTSVRLWFNDFVYLGRLQLANLSICSIQSHLFANLTNLLFLDLRHNLLRVISKGMFSGLSNLQHLYLYGNPIQALGESAFYGLYSIRYLHLNDLEINDIADGSFYGLQSIKRLSLANNHVSHLSASTWKGLEKLKWLNIEGNKIQNVPQNIFDRLTLDELHTGHFKFCCFATNVTDCTPKRDAFSSCDDLMDNYFLGVVVWILGVAAVLGNIAVIIVRLVAEYKQAASILIINLSISDFLMGVYLLIIASADVVYQGKYVFYIDQWLAGGWCKAAAFLSTLSSEMSVYMLVVITADRLVAITFPVTTKRLSCKSTLCIISLGWILLFILSALPLFGLSYFGENYIRNGACLLFNITSGKVQGWEYSTFVFYLFNVTGCVFLIMTYIYIYCVSYKTRKAANRVADDKEMEMAQRFVLIIVTDCLCWLPIVITSFMSLGGVIVNPKVSVWLAVVVLPINSALNPFLYTLSSLRQIKENRKRKRAVRTPQNR